MTTQITDDRASPAAPVIRARTGNALLGTGLMTLVAGVVLLTVIPALVHGSIAERVEQALRPAGWAALILGAVLLGLHYTMRRGNAAAEWGGYSEEAPKDGGGRLMDSSSTFKREPVLEFEETYPAPSPSLSTTEALYALRMPAATPFQHREQAWSPRVLATMQWQRFEALSEAFFAQVGFATHAKSHGEQGGVHLWLQSKRMDAPRIVQCKHRPSKPVGLKDLRDFFGVMRANQLKHGSYVTSSTFTPDALAFAKEHGIQAQDGAALLKLIALRTPEQQAALLAVAYGGTPV
ncbi:MULTISPECIES: restriction endonuclease [unclassified Variovorax]|jgi:restriction system protein|uniref:restriction endonuclease n=1 Tax=unclassified Variovorax TaxID=663243 RepID=UPI002B22C0B3|nr:MULTISPECIES: restriction endonuclease [unclassified Variovorax]MEB0059570.1 restriction endonuclease [Variovorax sp. LG9.2]MEB0114188.1 restriction endonuclease [Variovorax sp. RTB1]